MPKADLIFRPHKNSFSVTVKNLEKLSVEEIQKIQIFVSIRKGVFDFNTYTFSIQKKLGLEEFENLLKICEIDAVVTEEFKVSETEARVAFGHYKGMLYSELPDSYLLWLKANYRGAQRESIDKELLKRKL